MRSLFLVFLLLGFCGSANGQTLDWSETLNKVIENSYDLKISQIDINIGDSKIKNARSEYFPKLNMYSYNEYSRDLDGNNSQPAYIGNDFVLANSMYQNSLSLGLSYNLFDFGIRGDNLKIAKEDKTSKNAVYVQNLRDLELNIVEVYAKALLAYKEIKSKEEIIEIQRELANIKERLNVSGKVAKTTSLDEQIKVAELESNIDKIKNEFSKSLQDLSFFTREKYEPEIIELSDFETPTIFEENENPNLKIGRVEMINIEQTPEFKIYDIEIEKKKKELLIAKKQNLPAFSFSTNYYFYGSDPSNFGNAYENFKQKGLRFRLITSLPIFDGLKNKSERERLALEIERLEIEKEKKLNEFLAGYNKIKNDAQYSEKQMQNNNKILELIVENISMLDRLNENQLIDKETYLNQKIQLINKRLEAQQAQINDFVSFYKLDVMRKYENEMEKL